MTNDVTPETPAPRRRNGRMSIGVGLLAAGAIAGGVLAGTMSASADTTPTPSAASSSGTASGTDDRTTTKGADGQTGTRGQGGDRHSSTPVRDDEQALSTADAEKVTAAALKAVPGGTVYRVETDSGDAEYEAHMTTANGTEVTVKLDADFAVLGVEDGMGKGGGPSGQAPSGQAPSGQAPSDRAPSASSSSAAA